MKNTNKGIIFLSIGIYLTIVNTIMALLIDRVFYLHGEPDPLTYWIDWLSYYGALTFIPTAIGIYLIFISVRYFKKDRLIEK